MRRQYTLFDVDTRMPDPNGGGLVFRPRVDPILTPLRQLFAWSRSQRIPVVAMTCLQAGSVAGRLEDGAVVVPMNDPAGVWRQALTADAVFLERRSFGCGRDNLARGAYDVFTTNPQAGALVRELGPSHWIVFGASLEHCLRASAEGLLRLGRRVTVLHDALVQAPSGTPQSLRATLDNLREAGAQFCATEALLREAAVNA